MQYSCRLATAANHAIYCFSFDVSDIETIVLSLWRHNSTWKCTYGSLLITIIIIFYDYTVECCLIVHVVLRSEYMIHKRHLWYLWEQTLWDRSWSVTIFICCCDILACVSVCVFASVCEYLFSYVEMCVSCCINDSVVKCHGFFFLNRMNVIQACYQSFRLFMTSFFIEISSGKHSKAALLSSVSLIFELVAVSLLNIA